MIEINSLRKNFGRLTALNNVSLRLEKGKSYALIGPNASGKSTLIKCLLGLVKPDHGSIKVAGEDIKGNWAYREKIGYMPQIGNYPENMQIRQLFAMMKDIRKGTYTQPDEELIQSFQLKSIGDKYFSTLSGGTRQKVSASLAFLFNPDILVLDEPTAGLDPWSSEVFKEKVLTEKQNGKLILITSHILSDLEEIADEIIYLLDGNIVFQKSLQQLLEETGTRKLGKAIARVMGESFLQSTISQTVEK